MKIYIIPKSLIRCPLDPSEVKMKSSEWYILFKNNYGLRGAHDNSLPLKAIMRKSDLVDAHILRARLGNGSEKE